MAKGCVADQPLAAPASPAQQRHVCLGPGFIEKDQPFGLQVVLQLSPLVACGGDIGARLFRGAERLLWDGPPLLPGE
jgi:hypothetical protein